MFLGKPEPSRVRNEEGWEAPGVFGWAYLNTAFPDLAWVTGE